MVGYSMTAEQLFPYANEAVALAQLAKLMQAKQYLAERNIDAVAIGSKFEWKPGPTQLGQQR